MITPESQIGFLTNLQRLLSDGSFVATYKYALLLSLADISIERGDDGGGELEVPTVWIAEKFVAYYWRQTTPFVPRAPRLAGTILRQNTGGQAAVVKRIAAARLEFGDSLAGTKRNADAWSPLLKRVDRTVRDMPLWKLQTMGGESFDFLYPNVGRGSRIVLRPGVAACFRKFYGLIGDIVRGSWVRHVRRYNHELLGTTTDLSEFLFGSERSQLGEVREALKDTGASHCFYCERGLSDQTAHVDHFVPWSRYPVDLGHNFVLAHGKCNSSKSDHIASAEYLDKWVERNLSLGEDLDDAFAQRGVLSDLPTSARVAQWVYAAAADVGGVAWTSSPSGSPSMAPLEDRWQPVLERLISRYTA